MGELVVGARVGGMVGPCTRHTCVVELQAPLRGLAPEQRYRSRQTHRPSALPSAFAVEHRTRLER